MTLETCKCLYLFLYIPYLLVHECITKTYFDIVAPLWFAISHIFEKYGKLEQCFKSGFERIFLFRLHAKLCTLQSGRFCTTVREIFRTTFNAIGKGFHRPNQRYLKNKSSGHGKTWFLFRELSLESIFDKKKVYDDWQMDGVRGVGFLGGGRSPPSRQDL